VFEGVKWSFSKSKILSSMIQRFLSSYILNSISMANLALKKSGPE
jgi:hypothetical protein